MRYLSKNIKNRPASLMKHLKKPHHSYENYVEKDDLRQKLHSEQNGLCCYCMSQIQTPTADKMVIEHFKPQSKYPELQLEYTNLLASCTGGQNGLKHLRHCDETKKETEIALNPNDKKVMQLIKFDANGTVFTENLKLNIELDNILCLNIRTLKQQRRAIIDGINSLISSEFKSKIISKSYLINKINFWKDIDSKGFAKEYCQVAIYVLQKKLSKIQ